MKASGAAAQGVLAAVGLAAAYFAWQHEPEGAASEVTVLDLSKGSIASIDYDDPKQHVQMTRVTEGGEPVTWFTVTPKEAPPPVAAGDGGTADGGARDGGVAPAMPVMPAAASAMAGKVRQFRGNELADKLWEKFAPLRGARALGVLDPTKLKEVGLEKPDRSVVVNAGGAKHDYQIGTVAQGVANPYFRDALDGKVYLVKGTVLTDFEFASSRLVDRRLHTFQLNEVDGLKVKVGDTTRELVVSADGKVAPKATPSSPDAFAKNWSDKVFRLIVTEVLGKDETPVSGAPESELRIEYESKGKVLGWIEMGHSGTDVYARTEHTAGWMKLPVNTGDVLIEAKKVASGT